MVPTPPAGAVTVIWLSELTLKPDAGALPNATAVASVKFEPVTVTWAPPLTGPELGLTEVTVGGGLYVNWSAALTELSPPRLLTITLTVLGPGADGVVMGDLRVRIHAETGCCLAPSATAVAAVKLVPCTVTTVPPLSGPEVGEIEVAVGEAM